MHARVYPDLDALPPGYDALFDAAARESFFFSRPWFANLIATVAEAGEEARVYGIEAGGAALGALVARGGAGGAAQRTLRDYADPYATLHGPVLGVAPADAGPVLRCLAEAIAAERPRWNAIRLQGLDAGSPTFAALVEAFRRAGFLVQTYVGFGNWYEATAGLTLDGYLAARPSTLRNTLRRKGAKLERNPRARFEVVIADGPEIDTMLAAYGATHAASWKEPEPFPGFIAGLVRAAAAAGCLRFGALWVGDEPAAAQIWIVSGGRATIYKLAHDARFDSLSVGSVLTLRMIRRALEVDRVAEIDFGRGDDPYKRLWLPRRRERWGLVAFSPRTLAGAAGAARHLGGRAVKRALAGVGARFSADVGPP